MRVAPGLTPPALTFWQYVGIAAVTAVIVPLLVALIGRPRRTPPAVSVPTSSGTTVVLALGRRRWLTFLIALALAAFLLPSIDGRRIPPVNAEPPARLPQPPAPPAPCGEPVAWDGGLVAAGVVKHLGGHRVVVCATEGPGSAWQSTTVDDADDVYTWSEVTVFQDRAVLVGTAGTRMDDGRLAYDAAIWTCRFDAALSCPRIPDPAGALGGPQDQFIKSAELSPDGQRLVAHGGSGRGKVTHERVWVYDGARVSRRE
jgi:hypothetical protein